MITHKDIIMKYYREGNYAFHEGKPNECKYTDENMKYSWTTGWEQGEREKNFTIKEEDTVIYLESGNDESTIQSM